MNPDIMSRYAANRLRVVRQVRYSLHNENNLDLVLFLNGVPVATVELKTDFTQSIDDAVDQYRFDRNPSPKGQNPEPLLSFPNGALVHFAVSNSEVRMTTRLDGTRTRFLRKQIVRASVSGRRDHINTRRVRSGVNARLHSRSGSLNPSHLCLLCHTAFDLHCASLKFCTMHMPRLLPEIHRNGVAQRFRVLGRKGFEPVYVMIIKHRVEATAPPRFPFNHNPGNARRFPFRIPRHIECTAPDHQILCC